MKAVTTIRRILGLPAVTKSQSGFLIALVGLITIGGRETIVNIDVLNRNQAVACIALGVSGLVFWLGGRTSGNPVPSRQEHDISVDQARAENPLVFFKSLRSWGVMLVLSAAILSVFAEPRQIPICVIKVHARSLPKDLITVTNEVPVTSEIRQVSFPPLALRGIIVNGANSAAVINGQVLKIGEYIGDVRLVAVEPSYVTVELEGRTNWLVLPNSKGLR
jgi:hypothetical protein